MGKVQHDLKLVSGRARVPADGQVVWNPISTGNAIGYRHLGDGLGTWWARTRVDGKLKYGRLQGIDQLPASKQYDAALKAANKWIEHIQSGGTFELVTVEDACKAYAEDITDEAKRTRTYADFRRCVFDDPLAKVKLADLRPRHLGDWRKRIESLPVRVGRGAKLRERERAPGSINREMVPLRAALNRAYDRGEIATDMAWRSELKRIGNANRRRELLLSPRDRTKLVKHASSIARPFLQALSLLPLRPGAMAALTVADWDRKASTLRVPKDKVKAYEGRRFKVPPAAAAFFTEHCKGKLPTAPIFADAAGAAWTRHTWKDEVRDAAKAAGLPVETTAYSLRHSLLTEIIDGGAPLAVVAKVAGTSVDELSKTYHHLTDDSSVAALALVGRAL